MKCRKIYQGKYVHELIFSKGLVTIQIKWKSQSISATFLMHKLCIDIWGIHWFVYLPMHFALLYSEFLFTKFTFMRTFQFIYVKYWWNSKMSSRRCERMKLPDHVLFRKRTVKLIQEMTLRKMSSAFKSKNGCRNGTRHLYILISIWRKHLITAYMWGLSLIALGLFDESLVFMERFVNHR